MLESYKHLFAKQTLAKWLADPKQPFFGDGAPRIPLLEYPFCLNSDGKLLGEKPKDYVNCIADFENNTPTYQQCLAAKLLPICIFDVAVSCPDTGFIVHAFEIVHKHDLTEVKRSYVRRVMKESALLRVYGVDADWVLSQVGLPHKLQVLWQIAWRD